MMSATLETPSVPLSHRVQEWVERKVSEAIAGFDLFLAETYRDFIQREPSPDALSEHRLASRLMLGMARQLLAEVQDPDFPNRTLARQLATRVIRLDDYHQMLHHPMPEAEMHAILAQAFPDAPRA